MGTFKMPEGGDGWVHPQGLFPVQLVDHGTDKTEFGERIRWIWESNVEREDGKPPRLMHWTSDKLHEKSNAGKILIACGIALPVTAADYEAFDLGNHYGATCQALVVHGEDKEGKPRANIENFISANGATPAAADVKRCMLAGCRSPVVDGKEWCEPHLPKEPGILDAAGKPVTTGKPVSKDPFEDE